MSKIIYEDIIDPKYIERVREYELALKESARLMYKLLGDLQLEWPDFFEQS